MTPAVTMDAHLSATKLPTAEVEEQDWETQMVVFPDTTEPIGVGSEAIRDRLAPARGALLGITIGAALWGVLFLLIITRWIR